MTSITYKPKFKKGDIVIYNGKIRSTCTHDKEECGFVLKLPNCYQPYYWIGVMAYGGGIYTTHTYGFYHGVTFLNDGADLRLWRRQ